MKWVIAFFIASCICAITIVLCYIVGTYPLIGFTIISIIFIGLLTYALKDYAEKIVKKYFNKKSL